jgi:hypothetical protein
MTFNLCILSSDISANVGLKCFLVITHLSVDVGLMIFSNNLEFLPFRFHHHNIVTMKIIRDCLPKFVNSQSHLAAPNDVCAVSNAVYNANSHRYVTSWALSALHQTTIVYTRIEPSRKWPLVAAV